MIDGYLKFASKAEALKVFDGIGISFLTCPSSEIDGLRMDICILFGDGVVHRETGATVQDEFGNCAPVYSPVAGYHVNVRYEGNDLPAALLPYHLTPATPKCVWG